MADTKDKRGLFLQGDYSDHASGCLAEANGLHFADSGTQRGGSCPLTLGTVWNGLSAHDRPPCCPIPSNRPVKPPDTAHCTTNGGMENAFYCSNYPSPVRWTQSMGLLVAAHLVSLSLSFFLPFSPPPLPLALRLIPSSLSNLTGCDLSLTTGLAWYPFNGHIHLFFRHTISNWPAALSAVEQRLDSLINKSSLKHYYPTLVTE